MKRNLTVALLLSATLVGTGCASTKFISTWKAPNARQVDPAPGAVGVISMRVSEVDVERTRRPATYYSGPAYGGYWSSYPSRSAVAIPLDVSRETL